MSQLSPAVCVQVRLFTVASGGWFTALPSPKQAWWKALSASLKALSELAGRVVGGVKAEQCATTMTEFLLREEQVKEAQEPRLRQTEF